MAQAYKHSATFGSLKGVTEGIVGNLTSHQYLCTLQFFLKHGLDLLYGTAPAFIENFAAKVVATQTLKPSTKFSMNTKGVMPHHFYNLIITKDFAHFENMHLNRGILFGILSVFAHLVNTYDKIQARAVRVSKQTELRVQASIQDALGMEYKYNLFAISREVQYWEGKARWFKELIVQKYMRMALLQAQSTYKELACSFPLDDIAQIYLAYVAKAIDRCDSRQGVLTTFISSWLKSAKAEAARQAKDNYHTSYEELVEEGTQLGDVLPDMDFEALEHVASVAKQYDREGYVRATLRIPEFVSSKQRAVLQLFTLET